ncbi:H-2 class I histocompatibility antigen, alpha chain-like isoform X2 [Hoplias malabaricus]|uniref:H-2 class I histocompatibility antigen, alpha chain-like isoform X2 n=1 Tax=Hoplias malabaricus TaxID=27720 RepID=UPI00346348F2
MMGATGLWVFVLFGVLHLSLGDKHTLFYLFTAQSNHSVNNIYQFSVETLLDDTQMDSYSSRDGIRTPKQSWVKEIEESVWKDGTEKLKDDGYLLHEFFVTQMKFSGHDPSDNHVLQWRFGCEGEKLSDGSVSTLNCINQFAYDGEDLISYDWTLKKWTVSAGQDTELEKRWNSENGNPLLMICVDSLNWLKIYLLHSPTETKPTVPGVYVLKKSQTESSRLTLTCLATGFYHKDLKMRLRRFNTSLPDHLLTSSGVRPNGDGTYQLRKSVDVQEEDTAGYDCYVEHNAFNGSVIKPWDRIQFASSGVQDLTFGLVIGPVVLVVFVCGLIFDRKKTAISVKKHVSEVRWVIVNDPEAGDSGDVSGVGNSVGSNNDNNKSFRERKTDETTVMLEEPSNNPDTTDQLPEEQQTLTPTV